MINRKSIPAPTVSIPAQSSRPDHTTLAGEQITPGFLGGAVLVLLGVWFGALLPATRRR